VVGRVHDDLAPAAGRRHRHELGTRHGRRLRVRPQRGEAVVEDRDVEVRAADLAVPGAGRVGAERAAVGRRQERALLAVGRERDPLAGALLPEFDELTLNTEQSFVLSEIERPVATGEYSAFLLHGVTGSGKTEVYIRAMRAALKSDRSSLMLVPEIALTPIFSRRLRAVFGSSVAILHSNLSQGERFDEWRRIRRGDARVVIGTRSAVFAPLHNLGLVIVDEEHDSSYRQNESPFYNARDVAVMRASLASAVIVLGSATPSLESYNNAQAGKYHYLQLQNRIGGRPLAKATVVIGALQAVSANDGWYSIEFGCPSNGVIAGNPVMNVSLAGYASSSRAVGQSLSGVQRFDAALQKQD